MKNRIKSSEKQYNPHIVEYFKTIRCFQYIKFRNTDSVLSKFTKIFFKFQKSSTDRVKVFKIDDVGMLDERRDVCIDGNDVDGGCGFGGVLWLVDA